MNNAMWVGELKLSPAILMVFDQQNLLAYDTGDRYLVFARQSIN
ncbi:MAG TPA: hypothetical protein VJN48_08955 [Terriglobales bacterium]|nr:hypothetical protein [Terriglobales bacterium]